MWWWRLRKMGGKILIQHKKKPSVRAYISNLQNPSTKTKAKNQTCTRSTPVLVVALSDHTHLVKAGTALERNPLTISETKKTQSYLWAKEANFDETEAREWAQVNGVLLAGEVAEGAAETWRRWRVRASKRSLCLPIWADPKKGEAMENVVTFQQWWWRLKRVGEEP